MDAAQEAFLRSTVGLLAYSIQEVVAMVGGLNAATARDGDIEKSMGELHSVLARVLEAFPPPNEILQ